VCQGNINPVHCHWILLSQSKMNAKCHQKSNNFQCFFTSDLNTQLFRKSFRRTLHSDRHHRLLESSLPRCMQWKFCLSVRLSVKRVHCDKTEGSSVQIFIADFYRFFIAFSVIFWEEEWLVGATPSTWNFGSTGPIWSEIADFELIFARSASAVTPSENVQLKLIGSWLRAFQWA